MPTALLDLPDLCPNQCSRGFSCKPYLIRAILNTDRDQQPINPTKPSKSQTRRLGQIKWVPGQIISVLETYSLGQWHPADPFQIQCCYKATNTWRWVKVSPAERARILSRRAPQRPMPGRYMLACLPRILVQVTEARQCHLNSMSAADAICEGICDMSAPGLACYGVPDVVEAQCPVRAFSLLWDGINPDDPWESNPTVGVIGFSVVRIFPTE